MKNKKCNHFRRYLQAKNNSPFWAMIQFLLLLHQTKPKLEKINCPILIIQAEDDDTVRIKSVDYINKHISSDRKRIKYFHEGGHLILLSVMAEPVMLCIEDFLQEHLIRGISTLKDKPQHCFGN
jgi:carboxylesterase